MHRQGIPIIIAAPSGGGKTSLVNALVARLDHVKISVSHTTRSIRKGEQDGIDYHFVDQSEFDALVKAGAFLEYANVFGHYYGTSAIWLREQLAQGFDVILEIDWQGAQQIRRLMPETLSVFILPPSVTVLRERLQKRGQDDPEVIQRRMHKAQEEMSHYSEFDYLVINDNFDAALDDLITIVRSQHLRCPAQARVYKHLLTNLLA